MEDEHQGLWTQKSPFLSHWRIFSSCQQENNLKISLHSVSSYPSSYFLNFSDWPLNPSVSITVTCQWLQDTKQGWHLALEHRNFHLNMTRSFFTVKETKHWNRLPGEVVESPLERFKSCLDTILTTECLGALLERGLNKMSPSVPFQTYPFCDLSGTFYSSCTWGNEKVDVASHWLRFSAEIFHLVQALEIPWPLGVSICAWMPAKAGAASVPPEFSI